MYWHWVNRCVEHVSLQASVDELHVLLQVRHHLPMTNRSCLEKEALAWWMVTGRCWGGVTNGRWCPFLLESLACHTPEVPSSLSEMH